MSEKLAIAPTNTGLGVFSTVRFKPGERIFYVTGPLLDYDEVMALPRSGENSIQVGETQYVDPLFPGRYLNHSCDPNSGFINEICLVALRTIEPGEEIRFDYSTTMLEKLWELDCGCGSAFCRKLIQDFDLLPKEIQDRYLKLGVVQNFIVRSLMAQDDTDENRMRSDN